MCAMGTEIWIHLISLGCLKRIDTNSMPVPAQVDGILRLLYVDLSLNLVKEPFDPSAER